MRKDARKVAFSLIYEYFFTHQKDDIDFGQFTQKEDTDDTVFELDGADKSYVTNLYNKVIENFDDYKGKVVELSKGFREDRLYKVDLAILIMAVCEIDCKIVPIPVAINEAVNLAKIYSTDNSSGFINGILSEYVKNIKE